MSRRRWRHHAATGGWCTSTSGTGASHPRTRLLEDAAPRVRHRRARARRPSTSAQPRVGQDLVDRGPVAAGHDQSARRRPGSGRRGRPRPRRPAAPGCPGAGRTAAGSARRPWSGPARAAGRPWTRRSAPPPAAPPRSRPCGPAARPSRPAADRVRERRRLRAARRTARSNGSRAWNVRPVLARPARAPSATAQLGGPPCRLGEVGDPALDTAHGARGRPVTAPTLTEATLAVLMVTFAGVDHVSRLSTDLDRSLRFYTDGARLSCRCSTWATAGSACIPAPASPRR